MKNKFWLYSAISAFGVLLSQPAEARQLSANQALTRAQKSEASAPGMKKIRAAAQPKLVKTTLTERQGLPAFYIFENSEGLLIASADDRLPAVLGYSESGSFSEIPENMEWWLGQYEQEIGAYYEAAGEDTPQWTSTYDQYAGWAPLETLCKTQWGQTSPFNNDCPMLNGSRTVTGCVATALSQVIRYKGYLNCRGKKSYNWSAGNQTITYDFDQLKIDFSLLRDAYKGGATQAERDEVAKLMYAVAVAMNSNFNAATGTNYGDAIREYLGFNDYFTVHRAGMTSQEWERMCYELIKDGNPLAYGGSGTGGHAFICDGYSEDGFFHFNWGWSGTSDGYFRLSSLNPREQGTGSFEGGYTMSQNITVLRGDQDEKTDYYHSYRPGTVCWRTSMALNLAGTSNNAKQNTATMNLGIRYYLDNAVSYSENVGIGLICYNRDGQGATVYLPPSTYTQMMVRNGEPTSASIKFDRGLLTPGATYDAYPVYAFKDHEGYWRLNTAGTHPETDHWMIKVGDDSKITADLAKKINLGLNAYEMETNDLYVNDKENSFKCLLVNSSPEDVNHAISLRLYAANGNQVKDIATSYLLIASGETMPLEATFDLSDIKDAGEYTFKLYDVTRGELLGSLSELAVKVNAGKRPEDGKKPGLSGSYQVALWANGKMQEMTPQYLLSGDELKLTTSVTTYQSQEVDYSLAIFKYGETYSPLAKYHVEKNTIKGDGTWHQGATVEIKPELPVGVYTLAFIDQYESLVSLPTELYINTEVSGVRYSYDKDFEGLTVCGSNGALSGHLDIPAEVGGMEVKSVADGAFDRDQNLTSIALPAGVEKIGVNAFRASKLQTVSLDGKTAPFANVAIPFGSVGLGTEFYVDSEAYASYLPAFNYRGHALLYANMTGLTLPAEASVELSKELDLDIETAPAEHTNPNFTVAVADPDILSAEVSGGKLHITPVAPGETEVELTSAQPQGPKASVKVTVTDDTDSISEITATGAAETFDLLGRRVAAGARGLMISNGKVILKK